MAKYTTVSVRPASGGFIVVATKTREIPINPGLAQAMQGLGPRTATTSSEVEFVCASAEAVGDLVQQLFQPEGQGS